MIIRTSVLAISLILAGCGRKAEDIKQKKSNSTYVEKETSINDALYYAIDAQDTVLVREALKQGADVDALLQNGETALTFALKKRKTSLLTSLLQEKPVLDKANGDGERPLDIVIKNDDRSSLYLLINSKINLNPKYPDKKGVAPIELALEKSSQNIILDLIKAGANLGNRESKEKALRLAQERGYDEAAGLIDGILRFENKEALDEESIKKILFESNEHVIEYFYEKVKSKKFKTAEQSLNILSNALEIEDPEERDKVLRLLLRLGLSPNKHSEGKRVPLIEAAKDGKESALKTLLLYGADPNALDENSMTALAYAGKNLSIKMVQDLLVFGAKVEVSAPSYTKEKSDQDGDQFQEELISACDTLPEKKWFFGWNLSKQERYNLATIQMLMECY